VSLPAGVIRAANGVAVTARSSWVSVNTPMTQVSCACLETPPTASPFRHALAPLSPPLTFSAGFG
jgi:hypothetical protein